MRSCGVVFIGVISRRTWFVVLLIAVTATAVGCGGSGDGSSTASGKSASGAEQVLVPDLVGKTTSVARKAIASRGLEGHVVGITPGLCVGANIRSQHPLPGERVSAGTTIVLRRPCN